jgi:2-haloacid dehalogenase
VSPIVLFDVNGTLTDPAPIGAPWGRPELGVQALDRAVHTAMVDALLGTGDRPFSAHVRAAVEAMAADEALDPEALQTAVQAASALPARPDAGDALARCHDAGMRLVALTNSGADAGRRTLEACGLLDRFERVLGVDAVSTFKPHPDVYAYALRELDAAPAQVTLVATHPWDLAGAAHAGLATAWVRHGVCGWPSVFPAPSVQAETLGELARALSG